MSAQRLGPRRLRQIAATIGEPVLRGWSHGGYWLGFVTPDHRHGSWNVKSREVEWAGPLDRPCYGSCRELIPYMPPVRP